MNPEDGYHYRGYADPYFEGWYHKVVVPQSQQAFFFIYGVVNPLPQSAYPSHAFLYCGDGTTGETVFQQFPLDSFSAAADLRDVRIGSDARSTALRFAGAASSSTHSCRWDINLDNGVPWRETMGWMTGSLGFETSWTVGTISATASGWVEFDGERTTFEAGRGYCDHNWGSAFPQEWIWMQASGFAEPDLALAASGGSVPLGEVETEAYMIGLLRDDEMLTFRTQDFDTVTSIAEKGLWHLVAARDTARLTIDSSCDPTTMFHLRAPTEQGMEPRAWESLLGTVSIVLETRETAAAEWTVVLRDRAELAGVEVGE